MSRNSKTSPKHQNDQSATAPGRLFCPEIRKRRQNDRTINRQQFSGDIFAQESENLVKTTERSFGNSFWATILPRKPKGPAKTTERPIGNGFRPTFSPRNPKTSSKRQNDQSATVSGQHFCPETRKHHQNNRTINRQQFSGNNFAQEAEGVVKTPERSIGNSFRATILPGNPKTSSKRQSAFSATVSGQQF